MVKVLFRRLLGAIPVLLVLALVVFILRQVAPIDRRVSEMSSRSSRRDGFCGIENPPISLPNVRLGLGFR